MTRVEMVQEYQDPTAVEIGKDYRRGTQAYIDAGQKLIVRRASLNRGEWLPWLKANEKTLGFGERTAYRLMALAENPEMEVKETWGNQQREPKLVVDDKFDPEPITEHSKPLPIATRLKYFGELIEAVLSEKATAFSDEQIIMAVTKALKKWRARTEKAAPALH